MPNLYEPRIFKQFNNVRAALTLRGDAATPYGFNMSLGVGDDEARVGSNRARLAGRLGFDVSHLAVQRQVHGRTVRQVDEGYAPDDSDALVTDRCGWLLAISVADCVPILIHDAANNVV